MGAPSAWAVYSDRIRRTETRRLLRTEFDGLQRLVERKIHMDGAGIHSPRRGDGSAREHSYAPKITRRGLTGIEALPYERTVEVGLVDRLVRVGPPERVRPVSSEHKQRHSGL